MAEHKHIESRVPAGTNRQFTEPGVKDYATDVETVYEDFCAGRITHEELLGAYRQQRQIELSRLHAERGRGDGDRQEMPT